MLIYNQLHICTQSQKNDQSFTAACTDNDGINSKSDEEESSPATPPSLDFERDVEH